MSACVAIDKALTAEERERILARFFAMNPHWTGAHVADIIDVLDDSDANLDVLEPMYEEHEAEWTRLHSFALQAAVLLRAPARPSWDDVRGLVERAR